MAGVLAPRISPVPPLARAADRLGLGRTWRVRSIGALHILLLIVLAAAGALVNPRRVAWFERPSPIYRGFHVPYEQYEGKPVKWARDYAKIELPGASWRPLRIELQVTAHPDVGVREFTAFVAVNERVVRRVIVRSGWQDVDVVASAQGDLAVQLHTVAPPNTARALGLGELRVVPIMTRGNALRHGAIGALVGVFAWVLIVVRYVPQRPRGSAADRAYSRDSDDVQPSPGVRGRAALFIALTLCLGVWSVLKPVMQAPDEPQHLLRANSVLLQGWTDPPGTLTLDPRFANPIAFGPPPGVARLSFDQAHVPLTGPEIREAERVGWDVASPHSVPTPLTTYPAGYYGTVFLTGELATRGLRLTPYQSVFVYRFVTVLLAAALWVFVFQFLSRFPETSDRAWAIFALLVLNAMLAFVTSSVTPDSVNVPLATLAVLLAYRVARTGERLWPATIALVACALTKPTALLLAAAMAPACLALWYSGGLPETHIVPVALAVGRGALTSVLGFYAWSPPRFVAGPPVIATLNQYLAVFWDRLPDVWVTYWGQLGWLDYELSPIWYQLLAIVVLVNLVLAARSDPPPLARFGVVLFAAYVLIMMAGEFQLLPVAGYNFQGRHLFPVMIGTAGLVLHRRRAAWLSLLVALGVVNVLLMLETVQRYFGGDWRLVWQALP